MGTAGNVIRGKCSVFVGSAGQTAWSNMTNIGYTTDNGFKIGISRSGNDIEVDQEDMPIDWERTKEDHKISFTIAEVTLTNIARALGITGTTSTITLYQDMAFASLALQAPGPPIGTATSNSTRTYVYPYVLPDGDVMLVGGEKGKAQSVPAAFKYYRRSTSVLPTVTDA